MYTCTAVILTYLRCDQNAEDGRCKIKATHQKLKITGKAYDPCVGTFKYLKTCTACQAIGIDFKCCQPFLFQAFCILIFGLVNNTVKFSTCSCLREIGTGVCFWFIAGSKTLILLDCTGEIFHYVIVYCMKSVHFLYLKVQSI